MYGTPEATSHNFAFLAHVELIKSCDAPESNNMIIGHSLRKNVPTIDVLYAALQVHGIVHVALHQE
jgi:hypothetical protein